MNTYRHALLLAGSLLVCLMLVPHVSLGDDIFLSLEGIQGESTDEAHRGEIEVLAWSGSVTQSGTVVAGGGRRSGKVSFDDITVQQYVDSATPLLMLHAATGDLISNATLTVRSSDQFQVEYLIVELANVFITGVATNGAGEDDRLTETVTLDFESILMIYVPYDRDTGAQGAAIEAAWDVRANQKR